MKWIGSTRFEFYPLVLNFIHSFLINVWLVLNRVLNLLFLCFFSFFRFKIIQKNSFWFKTETQFDSFWFKTIHFDSKRFIMIQNDSIKKNSKRFIIIQSFFSRKLNRLVHVRNYNFESFLLVLNFIESKNEYYWVKFESFWIAICVESSGFWKPKNVEISDSKINSKTPKVPKTIHFDS